MKVTKNIILSTICCLIFSTLVFAGSWVKTTAPSGCLVWNEYPESGETATWSGEVSNGKASGFGVLEWYKKGSFTQKYIGTLKEGKKAGQGIYEWADGRLYTGNFHNNLRHGRGIFVDKDGSLYNGFWIDNKAVSNDIYQKYLDNTKSKFKVQDLIIDNIMLDDFYNQHKSKLGSPINKKEYETEYGNFQELTFKDIKLTLWLPPELEKRNQWIIDDITVISNAVKTARDITIGDSVDKVIHAYGKTPYFGDSGVGYSIDNSLQASGSSLSLHFAVKNKDKIISEISLNVGHEGDDN